MIQLDKLTIDTLLKQSFVKYGDLSAIASVGEKPMTYAELEKAVMKRIEGLTARGIRPDINRELPAFSSIHRMVWQKESFELTPTNKVKRFLYIKD